MRRKSHRKHVDDGQKAHETKSLFLSFCSQFSKLMIFSILGTVPVLCLGKEIIPGRVLAVLVEFIKVATFMPLPLTALVLSTRLFASAGANKDNCPFPILVIPMYVFYLHLGHHLISKFLPYLPLNETEPVMLSRAIAAIFVYVRLAFIQSERVSFTAVLVKLFTVSKQIGQLKGWARKVPDLIEGAAREIQWYPSNAASLIVRYKLNRSEVQDLKKAIDNAKATGSLLPSGASQDLVAIASSHEYCVELKNFGNKSPLMCALISSMLGQDGEGYIPVPTKNIVLLDSIAYEKLLIQVDYIVRSFMNSLMAESLFRKRGLSSWPS